MEDTVNDDLFEDLEIEENQIVKIQAYIRGKLVRKWFSELRAEYELVVKEIEKNSSVTVQWPSTGLGVPNVRKQKPTKKCVQDNSPLTSPRNSPNFNLPKNTNVNTKSRNCPVNTQISKTIDQQLLSGRSSVSSDFSETAFTPIVKQIETLYTADQERFSKHLGEHENQACTVETQTSVEEKDSQQQILKTEREKTEPKMSVKTYDMLIQTDDLPYHKEGKGSPMETSTQSSDSSPSQDGRKQCLNREVLEQKIHKFESQLQTLNMLKDISQQKTMKETENKVPANDTSLARVSKHADKYLTENEKTNRVSFSESSRGHKPSYQHESSVLTNVSSVWDSFSSECKENVEDNIPTVPVNYPTDPEALKEMRKNVAMELLWVQQAIDSRKNYLKLKNQMRVAT